MTSKAFDRQARRLEALAAAASAKERALRASVDACETQTRWLATNRWTLRRWPLRIGNQVPVDSSVDVWTHATRFTRWITLMYLLHWRLWRSRLDCARCRAGVAALRMWERVSDFLQDDALFFLTLFVVVLLLVIVVLLLVV